MTAHENLRAFIKEFVIQEEVFGEEIPDFWNELDMTERLAFALSEAGFERNPEKSR